MKISLFFVFIGFFTLTRSISSKPTDKIQYDLSLKEDIDNRPTSEALPAGMKLIWSDEFNGKSLDKSKWVTDYYSSIDFIERTNYEKLLNGELPQPGIRFTGHSIILITDDRIPTEPYFLSGRKVSSIQTYDWKEDKLLLDNSLGGFIEARIKRICTADATMVNGAFWLDSPGPDAKYFIEQGNTALGATGIRPRGQVFEIDLCENLNTEIVLHGNVSPEGIFEHNIGHFPIEGDYVNKWVTHSMLWSPAGFKFYIDGRLVKEDWNPHNIKSPNHAMNVFLGMYAKGGTASMEVDYIRYYRWKLKKLNELPNPGFEYYEGLFPWEGKGHIATLSSRTGKYGVELAAGDSIAQYVYLDHSCPYSMKFWTKGPGGITAIVENITQVSGSVANYTGSTFQVGQDFSRNEIRFSTSPEYGNHKRTVKVIFTNSGTSPISLDDITIEKIIKNESVL
ncbi:MAG: glycoside hydrolase family 16 protein [Prevotella sp.]|nr:glycoside hydrolase family 16 protein [Prevotella sp.]